MRCVQQLIKTNKKATSRKVVSEFGIQDSLTSLVYHPQLIFAKKRYIQAFNVLVMGIIFSDVANYRAGG